MDLQRNTVKSEPGMSRFGNISKSDRISQIIIGVVLFLIIYSFVTTSIVPKKYNLTVGDIAPEDIMSPKDAENRSATQKKKDEIKEKVQKIYITDYSIREEALKNVRDFFSKVMEIRSLQNVDDKAKKERLKMESTILLAEDDYELAIKQSTSTADLRTLQDYIINSLKETLSQDISNNEKDLKQNQDDFASNIKRNLKLNNDMRNLGIDIGFALIKSNQVYNSRETDEKVKREIDSVAPVMIKKNQNIIKKGEVVTEDHIKMLEDVNLLEQQDKIDYQLYIGIGILIALLEGLVIVYLYRFSPEILKNRSKLILMGIIITVELLLAKVVSLYNISGYIMPIAFAPMLVAILMKPRLALILNIALSTFVTLMTGYNINTFIVAIIGGSAGAIVVSRMHQRNDLITAGLVVSLVNVLSILGIGFISSAQTIPVLKQGILGVISGSLSSIFTLGLLPFCETIFDIITPIKLLELSNPNQPLLKKLLFEAPGTYHHSVIVGNLAEAAVDAIGGNSVLARVGAYYHDVGKIKRPYFFKENQLTNDNPHDKITPSLSTLIITNHIKDGMDLAKKYKVPTVIRDMIEQHHGTTLVKYFYVKAVNDSDSHDEITETQFRYEGPKPQSKEAAVVMLADSVEAAVRSISAHTRAKIDEMVKKIIKDKLDDGQLDECDLTLKEINKISTSFLNVLSGIYHDRIEYPDDTHNMGGGEQNESNDR